MAVLSTRVSTRIRFTLYVVQDIGPEGTEVAYDICDDGYTIRIKKEDGTQIDMLNLSLLREPNQSTAAGLLHDWATAKWGKPE